jgi:hypothetical protein
MFNSSGKLAFFLEPNETLKMNHKELLIFVSYVVFFLTAPFAIFSRGFHKIFLSTNDFTNDKNEATLINN